MVRSTVQARAIAQVVGAMKHNVPSDASYEPSVTPVPLRVVNGMPSPSSTTIATTPGTMKLPSPQLSPDPDVDAASITPTISHPYANAGFSNPPSAWPASTLRQQGLPVHEEEASDEESLDPHNQSFDPWARRRAEATYVQAPARQRKVTPSLTTLEKAVSARIYFENLYFPLLRQQPSREQRRLAMEREMEQLGMTDAQRTVMRERWRQNETEYLRERRAKVDVSAFVKLKTIGHG